MGWPFRAQLNNCGRSAATQAHFKHNRRASLPIRYLLQQPGDSRRYGLQSLPAITPIIVVFAGAIETDDAEQFARIDVL
jgi:hypothetical protein